MSAVVILLEGNICAWGELIKDHGEEAVPKVLEALVIFDSRSMQIGTAEQLNSTEALPTWLGRLTAQDATSENIMSESKMAPSLSHALCYLNSITIASQPSTSAENASTKVNAQNKRSNRVLVVSLNKEATEEHSILMNLFFTASKHSIGIDVACLSTPSVVLQQGADITGGICLQIPSPNLLKPNLITHVICPRTSRTFFSKQLHESIDYSAACVCHGTLIKEGWASLPHLNSTCCRMSQDWDNWNDSSWNQQSSYNQQQEQHHHHQQQPNYGGNDYYSQQAAAFNQPSAPQGNQVNFGYNSNAAPQMPNMFIPGGINTLLNNEGMMNVAADFGNKFAQDQKEMIKQYVSGFNLKYYFAVNNSYVAKKIGLLLFPFFHRRWELSSSSGEPMAAKDDINAPDLYIPLMAFMTYVLVSGFALGTQDRFIMNISQSLSIWHSLAYSTYKFVGMIVCLLAFIIGGKAVYYWTLAYISLALVFFLLRAVANYLLDTNHSYSFDEGRKRKMMLVLFIVVSQPFVMWWLTSGVTSFDAGKYDFARMAMDRMGIANAGKAQVPMTADGDVDYEALLKMPK